MWDLHVMAQFKVTGKFKCMHHGDEAPCFEQHRCNRAAGEDVSNDKLREDVSPIVSFVMATIMPMGIMYMNAENTDVNT